MSSSNTLSIAALIAVVIGAGILLKEVLRQECRETIPEAAQALPENVAPGFIQDEAYETFPEDEEAAGSSDEGAAFQTFLDDWSNTTKTVDEKDVAEFVDLFGKLPEARRDEFLAHALNLIPDDKLELLLGILMDKTQPKDVLSAVFNDILNRDDEVKFLVLSEIAKDREHPCWVDAMWVLDVMSDCNGVRPN